MPADTSGRIIKTSKGKKGTPHHKNHRWESFATKISKLNSLDPLKRVRRYDLDTEDLAATTSYFKNGLEKWQELNVSGLFGDFTRDILPLCDSLPQIIHFEYKIMDLLVTHLQMKERESIEPLLELMADFAHDLGTRFEKHYSQALESVTLIARTSEDVEVIEWSFACLTFMFKYLSKLLVLDLRPTYDLMAPLLGKERQKPHIARFAAEAMSYLVKKASAPAVRDKALSNIIPYIEIDLLSTYGSRQYGLYYHGVMTLFAEAMKGNGLSVHSSAAAIIDRLFRQYGGEERLDFYRSPWSDVICGVLTSLVHHSSADSLMDVVAAVLEHASASLLTLQTASTALNFQHLLVLVRAIGTLVGVRKGSRIGDWPALLKSFSKILEGLSLRFKTMSTLEKDPRLWDSVVLSTAIVLQYAPVDALIPFISAFLGSLVQGRLARWFLKFCSYFAEVEAERFRSLVLPYFKRFVVAHWSEADQEDILCILIPKFVSSGVLTSSYGNKDSFSLPQSWQDQIVSKFERLEVSPFPEQGSNTSYDRSPEVWHERCLPRYRALLEILDCSTAHSSTNARIAEILLRKLKLALRPSSALAPYEAHFILGRGFKSFSRMMKAVGQTDKSLLPLLRAAARRYCRLPPFLEAMILYEKSLTDTVIPDCEDLQSVFDLRRWATDSDGETDILLASLVDNLSTESHILRLLSLRVLDERYRKSVKSSSEVLTIMLTIEQTPLDLQTSRYVSMHIRTLAAMYKHHTHDPLLSRAIPTFCFGMLTVKLVQIWTDARIALSQIAEVSTGEDIVAEIAFRWLEMPSKMRDGPIRAIEQGKVDGLTDFECSNLIKLKEVARNIESELESAQQKLLQMFEEGVQLVAVQPSTARAQALRVLIDAPKIAERRSRQLVPMLLLWAGHEEAIPHKEKSEDVSSKSGWTRRDQKAQLELFSQFTNPRVLHRSAEVYSALLVLLANGDLEIQKLALRSIFKWKYPDVKPYEERLLNLLDEARFKDEITMLMHGETIIQPQHRLQLMPILLRVLYGRTIARKGAESGKQGMEGRRLTVLRSLNNEDIGDFLDIALGPLVHAKTIGNSDSKDSMVEKEILSVRKQLGFVKMMEDVLRELGSNVALFTPKVLPAILYSSIFAARQLRKASEFSEDDEEAANQASMLKVIRQTGYKCLNLLFTNDANFDWSPYLETILEELVRPRLEKLPIESATGISGLLQLLSTWSSSPNTVLYLGKDKQILLRITECLTIPKSKDEIKIFCLGIIRNVVKYARIDLPELELLVPQVKGSLLDTNIDVFLIHIGTVLRFHQDPSKELLEECVATVYELGLFVSRSSQAQNLVDISIFLLDQPIRRVSPKVKNGLLQILERFVPLYDLQDDATLKDKVYSTISSLFGFFRDRASREVLSSVLLVYSRTDPVIREVAALCADLNSFSDVRLDEPDYDRRLRAFTSITKKREISFTDRQWRPLLYNMLFYIRQDEEFGILSSNSSDGICHFLDDAQRALESTEKADFKCTISMILLPALYSGAREESEVVRREYVKVMAHLVKSFPNWNDVNDMQALLGGDEELEASFFNNILTAGKGRQSGALVRLATSAERGELSSRNVSHFFIPLIEHFIFDRAEGSEAHVLASEATSTLSLLAKSLEWPQYRALLRRFITYITKKPELEKQIIKLLGKVIDALASAAEKKALDDAEEEQLYGQEDALIVRTSQELKKKPRLNLVRTLPKDIKFTEDLTSNVLPPLLAYLHNKDESTVSLRVPIAVIIVRLLKLLPNERMMERLPAVLTDICHILRSKSQVSRDMTRDTLTKICVLLGPSCFGFVLKELRGALARGYQLHVLSYTMHSILVATTPEYSPGDLDYCLPSIVAIIMDDIFGTTGQEKDADGYVSSMKEVRSSKSHDSMELIAQNATLSRLTDIVRPIQVLLKEKLNLKIVRKIDELLGRITTGLLKNSAAQSRDSLVFCYEVIQDVYLGNKPQAKAKEDYRLKKYLVQRSANKSGSRGSTTVYTYKLVRFSFDVMRSVLKKYENLRTAANLAGFIPIIGDALIHAEDEVKVASFRLLTAIVKVPIKFSDATNLYQIAAAEATRSMLSSSSTTSDISQAALKLISVILHDRDDVKIKDAILDNILVRLRDVMTDPERRHVVFNFLRAVMDSKLESAAIYDTLDYVGTVMVTNDDKDTRDVARGAYFQFLREYPQKKARWSKQLAFIVANLKYEREGGRLSILEVIHLLLLKSSNDFVQEVSATCFVPLIFVLVNDDSEKCRMAAGEVIKETFKKADKERMQIFLGLLRAWINQSDNASVMRLGFLSYSFYYEARTRDDSMINDILASILSVLRNAKDPNSDWEVIYAALQLVSTISLAFPDRLQQADATDLWIAMRPCLSYHHAWIKLSSARLLSTYLADFARTNTERGLQSMPLKGSLGLQLGAEDLMELIGRVLNMFKTPGLTELLASEIVKNLAFLGQCAGANDLNWKALNIVENEGSDNEDEFVGENEPNLQTALNHIFRRLSFILRRETSPPRAPALIPKTAALQLLQILCNKLSNDTLSPYLQPILLPLHNLTDPNITIPYSTDDLFKAGYESIKANSRELMSLLQSKYGTANYTAQLLRVREGVMTRRHQRSTKRKIEAVSAPVKFGRDKKKKVERKKERRKEKGLEHREQRRGW